MAESDSGSPPIRWSRIAVSRTPKPQSIKTRVVPASTMSPLPSLPLPIDAKRIRAWRLLELVLEEGEYLFAVLRAIRIALRILHTHDARRRNFDDLDPVLLRLVLVVGLPEHEFRHPTLLAIPFRHVGVGIGIANEIDAGRTIAVDDGEARAVEGEPDAAPRAIERIVDDQLRRAV